MSDFTVSVIVFGVAAGVLAWDQWHKARNEHLRPGWELHPERKGDKP